MKNTYLSLFVLLLSTTALSATTQTVRTSAKLTEYYTKKSSNSGLTFDRTSIEIGNRTEDMAPNEKSVQTRISSVKKKLAKSDQLQFVKVTAEKMGSFKIENMDETRFSSKHCTITKLEKVCHSSIDLEMTVLID